MTEEMSGRERVLVRRRRTSRGSRWRRSLRSPRGSRGRWHADEPVDPRKKWRRRILLGLLALFLLVLAYLLWLLWWAHHNIHREFLLPDDPGNSKGENVLLIGSDSRDVSDPNQNGRSDVIQLIHIDEGRKRAYVVHFPRDLYVSIPCGDTHCNGLSPSDNKAKINASYSWGALWHKPGLKPSEGAAQLLVQTLEDLLSVKGQPRFHVDHVVVMGFCGFANLTDDLGGVDINVRQAYDEGVQPANASCASGGGAFGQWSVGIHHMSGLQALGFVRERHQLAQGDVDRGKDQQAWMAAVFRKVTTSGALLNPVELPKLISDGLSNTIVDQTMGMGYFLGLGRSIATNNLKISYFTAPFAFNLPYVPHVGSVVGFDPKLMAELAYDLRNDTMSEYTLNQNEVD